MKILINIKKAFYLLGGFFLPKKIITMNKFETESRKNFKGNDVDEVIEMNYDVAKSQFGMLKNLADTHLTMMKGQLKKLEVTKNKLLYPSTQIENADAYSKSVLEAERSIATLKEDISVAEKTRDFYAGILEEINS